MATMTAPPHTDTVVALREERDSDSVALTWTTDDETAGLVARYRLADGTLEVADDRYAGAAMSQVLDACVAVLTEPANGALVWSIAEQRLVRRLADGFGSLTAGHVPDTAPNR